MIWKTKIIRLSNLIGMLALLIMRFGEGLANKNGATTQFTIGHLTDAKTSPESAVAISRVSAPGTNEGRVSGSFSLPEALGWPWVGDFPTSP
jgi:hypothetical protein